MSEKRVGISLAPALHEKLRRTAAIEHRSMTGQVEWIVKQYLNSREDVVAQDDPPAPVTSESAETGTMEPTPPAPELPPVVDETVRRWLDLCPVDPSLRTPRTTLQRSYRILMWQPGMRLVSPGTFYQQLRALGLREVKINGTRFIRGIGCPPAP